MKQGRIITKQLEKEAPTTSEELKSAMEEGVNQFFLILEEAHVDPMSLPGVVMQVSIDGKTVFFTMGIQIGKRTIN